jgi:hypothetical protein
MASRLSPGGTLDYEQRLLEEIADKSMTRDDVAVTYAGALRRCLEDVHWPRVNAAIMERWSPNALHYIKREAWALVSERAKSGDRP